MVLEQWGILHLLWQGALVLSVSFWRTALFYHLKDRPILSVSFEGLPYFVIWRTVLFCHLKERPILSFEGPPYLSFEGPPYFVGLIWRIALFKVSFEGPSYFVGLIWRTTLFCRYHLKGRHILSFALLFSIIFIKFLFWMVHMPLSPTCIIR